MVLVFIVCSAFFAQASEITDTFAEKYKALMPRESSSVHSDYLFEQISLGSQYTILLLDQLSTKTDQGNDKLDRIMEKFDILIEQNQKIIQLLEKKDEPGK
jgi:hypothetical protein